MKSMNKLQLMNLDINRSQVVAQKGTGMHNPKTLTPPKLPTKQKKLRFSESSTLFLAPRKSSTEMASSWLGTDEIIQFKNNAKKDLQIMRGTPSSHAIKYIGCCVQNGEHQVNDLGLNALNTFVDLNI